MAVPSAPPGFNWSHNPPTPPRPTPATATSYVPNPPSLSEEEIVERLQDYMSQHSCCGDQDFHKLVKFHEIQSVPILLYTLELFIEKRTKEFCTEPFRGEYIPPTHGVGFGSSVPIDIWTLGEPIPPGARFACGKEIKVHREVPGSISVVNCSRCSGIGSTQCGLCQGSSMGPCQNCRATGFVMNEATSERLTCNQCHGRGRIGCSACRTQGTVSCGQCKGFRQVKNFEKMTITWTSTKENFLNFSGEIKISSSKMSNVSGKLVIEDTSPVPRELIGFPTSIPHFNKAVSQEHSKPNSRILEISQKIYQIPATEVIYEYKGKVKKFLVYGEQELVYFPKGLPTSCCTIV